MDCYESGMKLSKLQDGESDTKKRINKILKQVTELHEKKPATNKRTAKINMIIDLLNQLKEEEESEEEEDDKLESMKKLEEEKKLELMKKSEEEKKLELIKKLEEE
ncbi:PREDICTED: trichohyalin-like [Erythranthe guttata]|uniref:trichohyalin-like n=1 Tax=Erythranthe guttata TaxID=4155 RepID=UPI00064DFB99|nr:PREDICTED: trichohyalin-like [Erythranthe guttata]|eukprot:XP_012858660.1 PREDICTED: trichohyalin-like [Erythranthe guttata]